LTRKRDEIARSIAAYENKLNQTRANLAHTNGLWRKRHTRSGQQHLG
jgi:hypothetical protein